MATVRYLLDEDLSHEIATIARNLGIDVISCHEIDRNGFTDEEQLQFAADGRRSCHCYHQRPSLHCTDKSFL
ncbi:MAG: DUF5615 family PIN-like protein [Dehalococcoidia bacterium]